MIKKNIFGKATIYLVIAVFLFLQYPFRVGASFLNFDSEKKDSFVDEVANKQEVFVEKQTAETFKEKADKIHIPFIENQGQLKNEAVKYYAPIFSGSVFVTKEGLTYSVVKKEKQNIQTGFSQSDNKGFSGYFFQEKFLGKDSEVAGIDPAGEEAGSAQLSYFKGNNPELWKNNVNNFGLLNLGYPWEKIEVKLRAYGNNVEKLFFVEPGGAVHNIKMKIEGIDSMEVSAEGELILKTSSGNLSMTKPVAYQSVRNGEKIDIPVKYRLLDDTSYTFEIGDYDQSKLLVIDPLLASTYLGGSGSTDGIYSMAVDDDNNVFVFGITNSADFPTVLGAYDTTDNVNYDFFISKFNSSLTVLLASTYLGGAGMDYNSNQLIIDSSGNVVIVGNSPSADYPVTAGVYDGTFNNNNDVIVSKLDNNLSSLLASTYVGGASNDYGWGIVEDSAGNYLITGHTSSVAFPTTAGAYNRTFAGTTENFVFRINSTLTTLAASTFVGNANSYAIELDSNENIFIAGIVGFTATYPTTAGAYRETRYETTYQDVIISKLSYDLSSLLAATYLGGSSSDLPGTNNSSMLAVDSFDNIYVAGDTQSANFPTTAGAYDQTLSGTKDSFIAKFNNNLTSLAAATFLGGSGSEEGAAIIIDASGYIYHTGFTSSVNFPTTAGAYRETYNVGDEDVFISKLNSNLSSLVASTYIGGSEDSEFSYALAFDNSENIYVAGYTYANNYPVTSGAYDSSLSNSTDAFISKLTNDLSAHILDHMAVRTKLVLESQGFEDGTFPPSASWTTGGSANWNRSNTVTYGGSTGSAVSGDISDSSQTWIDADYDFPSAGMMQFYWKVSSEEDYDYLLFCVDNDACTSAGGYRDRISGEVDWTKISISVTPGSHSFRWVYTKDSGWSDGSDLGWIDDVEFIAYDSAIDMSSGVSTTINIAAIDEAGDNFLLYTGDKSITFSGAASSGGNHPFCTDKNGNDVDFGNPTTLAFVAGEASCDLTLYAAETAHIDITDGTYNSLASEAYDLDVTVSGAPGPTVSAQNSLLTALPAPAAINEPVSVTLTAYDTEGDAYTSGGATVVINVGGANSAVPSVTDNGDGTYTATYTPVNAGTDLITATLNGTAVGADSDGTSDGTYHLSVNATDEVVLSSVNSVLAAAPDPVLAGNLVTVTLTAKDNNGDAYTSGGATVVINVGGANSAVPSVTDNGDGTYTATYTPVNAGTDLITATLSGSAVGADSDGTSDGTYHLTVNPGTTEEDNNEDGQEEEKHLDIDKKQSGEVSFDVYIPEGEDDSAYISDQEDMGTGIKTITLEAQDGHTLDGDLTIKKFKDEQVKAPLTDSYKQDTCYVYKSLEIESNLDDSDLAQATLAFRVPYAWLNDLKIANLILGRGTEVDFSTVKTKAISGVLQSNAEMEVEVSKLSRYWVIVGCTEEKSEVVVTADVREEDQAEETPSGRDDVVFQAPATGGTIETRPENSKRSAGSPLQTQLVSEEAVNVLNVELKRTGLLAFLLMLFSFFRFLFALNSPTDLPLAMRQSFFSIIGVLGKKKKEWVDWGIVYDVDSGRPLPLSRVDIVDIKGGHTKEAKLTDKDGAYYFLASPGDYKLEVRKNGYQPLVVKNAPLLPVMYKPTYDFKPFTLEDYDKVDYHVSMRQGKANFTGHFQQLWGSFFFEWLFWGGLLFDIYVVLVSPTVLNLILFLLYIYFGFIRNLFTGFGPKWGLVADSAGKVQPFCTIKLSKKGEVVTRTVSDEKGRYFLIAGPGDYILEASASSGAHDADEVSFRQPVSFKEKQSFKETIVLE